MSDPIDPIEELERAFERFGSTLTPSVRALAQAIAENAVGAAKIRAVLAAESDLAGVMRALFVESALMGARRTIMHADAEAGEPVQTQTIEVKYGQTVPRVPPSSAISEMLRREPRLAATAEEVSRLYSTEHVFALARSASDVLTRRVQDVIVATLQSGLSTPSAAKIVASMGDFDRAYAENVVATNLNTAYTDGIFKQMRQPGIRDVMVGLEIVGPDDSSTRPNHAAAIGWRAEVDDPRWGGPNAMRPPLGWRCRHGLNYITSYEAERRGWLDRNGRLIPVPIPAGAGPDPGFRSGTGASRFP